MIYQDYTYINTILMSYIDQGNFQKSYVHPIGRNLQNINKCLAKVLGRARTLMENLLLPGFTHILKIDSA